MTLLLANQFADIFCANNMLDIHLKIVLLDFVKGIVTLKIKIII